MFRRIGRSARIGASYASTLGQLAALEARQEIDHLARRLRMRLIAIVAVLFGVCWLNIGVFTLIWDSPYRHWLPFAIGLGLMLVALIVWQTARLPDSQPAFSGSRAALEQDMRLWNVDLAPDHVLHPERSAAQSGSATPSEAGERPATIDALQHDLGLLRAALKDSVAGPPKPRADPSDPSRPGGVHGRAEGQTGQRGFQPRSRTMRTLMSVVGRGRDGAASQLPLRELAALGAMGLMRQRNALRWLVAAWPIIRIALSLMRDKRRAGVDAADVPPRPSPDPVLPSDSEPVAASSPRTGQ